MRIQRILVAALLGFAAMSPTLSEPAQATTIAPLTTEQMTDASTYIVEGTITRVWVEEDEDGRVWTRAALAVETVFKGPDTPTELIIDSQGGHSWRSVTIVNGQARFSRGERTLVFLDTIRHGTRLTPVGQFYGKFTVRRAAGDTRSHAMRWHGTPNGPFDAQFLPYPAPEDRVYVDDLKDAIVNRLGTGWDGQPIPGIEAERLKTINLPERRIVREVTR